MAATLRPSNSIYHLTDVNNTKIKATSSHPNAELDIEEKKEETPHQTPPAPKQQTATEKLTTGVLEARKSLIKVIMEHRFKQRFSSTALKLDSSLSSSQLGSSTTGALESDSGKNISPSQIARFRHPSRADSGLVVGASNSFASCSSETKQQRQNEIDITPSIAEEAVSITQEEREYLEKLILEGDVATMEAARERLKDTTLFPTSDMMERIIPNEQNGDSLQSAENDKSSESNNIFRDASEKPPMSPTSNGNKTITPNSDKKEPPKRRDSRVQQRLFKIHQERKLQPSRVLQYLKQNSLLQSSEELKDSSEGPQDGDSSSVVAKDNDKASHVVEKQRPKLANHFKSTPIETSGKNLITDLSESTTRNELSSSIVSGISWNPTGAEESEQIMPSQQNALTPQVDSPNPCKDDDAADDDDHSTAEDSYSEVDPFSDIASWIDGGQGVEVNDSGIPLIGRSSSSASSTKSASGSKVNTSGNNPESDNLTNQPFRILGTSADDVTCHPHVLSPPLMESLLAFMPEGLMNYNYWIKYSLVRDGASMWTMMRKVRASNATVLAIETVDGHVFGAFTNHSWRFSVGWYGGQQAFLWKLRRSRLETTTSIFEQAVQESEVQVFPVRPGNVAVQYCSKECLMLGRGEIQGRSPEKYGGKHYGHGIYLDSTLLRGTTSSSETFGNPCLVDDAERGARFDVSNIEIWTLTPHDNVNEAQQSELSTMFLEGGREGDNLNLLGILVGGPI